MTFEYIRDKDMLHGVKAWNRGVPFDDGTIAQLKSLANMPFIHKHVAAMPDAHVGRGATVGSVIATKGAIIPAAVGVDLGCGMMAYKTTLMAEDLPDNLFQIRCDMESVIPHGRSDNGHLYSDVGGWRADPPRASRKAWEDLMVRYAMIISKHPKAKAHNTYNHLGTLGTGNHFVELCLDEEGGVWVMLHSGSRGAGNRIGSYFIELAKKEMERFFISLPDGDLSYLVEGTEHFNDYVEAVDWAQDFALKNREIMMKHALMVLVSHIAKPFSVTEMAVNCHHNYIAKENHFGENVWVTRKGAVRARKGDLGIIPGSMGTGSFIVEGLGNAASFCSCSHGAGRVMSRTEAKRLITLEDHIAATAGIECRKDEGILDESPAAYKDIGAVMAAQEDLVSIKYRIKQVLNIKG